MEPYQSEFRYGQVHRSLREHSGAAGLNVYNDVDLTSWQFYALQNLATTPGGNIYNTLFRGPPPTTFMAFGQVDAAYVLNAALSFAQANQSISTSST